MRTRVASVVAGLAVTASVALPAQAALATPPRRPGPPTQALLKLADAPGARAAVAAYARSHGLRIVQNGPGFVVVEGETTDAAAAFDTRPGGRPLVPHGLAGRVSDVVGLDNRRLFHAHAVPGYSGGDVRAAYDTTTGTGGAGITVATVQFSGWTSGDLQTYASGAGITLAPNQVTTIGVAGADPTARDGDGDVEVAMDVEAILGIAPKAKQRVYVAPNSGTGAVAAYQQVLADVKAGLVQVVSESWGSCESDTGSYWMSQMGQVIDQIVQAGATFFASSGDQGAYACYTSSGSIDTSRPSVNFPASRPTVVGVGGTALRQTSSGWSETGWAGSGGGQSSTYARPAYQANTGLAGSGRLVPDVSADAYAQTGMGIYVGRAGGWMLGGGTSLAAPIWAGSLAVTLANAGRTTGIGDIHDKLYANASALRDVTSGGGSVFTASTGYDEVTGLGSPLWSKLGSALLASTAPPPAPSSGGGTSTTTASQDPSATSPPPDSTSPPPSTTSPSPTPSPTPPPSSTSPTPPPPADPTPRTTADSCPDGSVPRAGFTDIPAGDGFAGTIDCVVWWGVARGVSPTAYRPGHAITRAQMAAFVARLVTHSGGTLPSSPPDAFRDDDQSPLQLQINQLAAVGVVHGTGPGTFAPNSPVTRAQMASFLARAYAYRTSVDLPAGGAYFDDVSGNPHEADIDAVAAAGLAGGYGDGTYRPNTAVTREQMSAFVARLLDLLVADSYSSPPSS